MSKHMLFPVRHRKSYAKLSTLGDSDTCIVFVHGLRGNAVTTWEYFAELCDDVRLPGIEMIARSDLFFFDYAAEKTFVNSSAYELAGFLIRLFPKPDMNVFWLTTQDAQAIRNPWLPYSRLILVGHSLGAVVIRDCILNQFSSPPSRVPAPWLEICEIRLFAAAHLGFRPVGYKGLMYELLPALIASLPMLSRAYSDVQPNSKTLTDLRTRTEELSKGYPDLKCLRALLAYGRAENLVEPGRYNCDFSIQWIEGRDHTDVCKPTVSFTDPISFVTDDFYSPATIC